MAARRRIILRVLAIAVGAALLAALLAFGLFRADPSWYRRVQLTDQQQAAGQQRLLDRLATLRNQVGQSQANVLPAKAGKLASSQPIGPPFEIEITEEEVNGVLMRWAAVDPHARAALMEISEPHVRFLDGRIELAGRSAKLGSLVSIELTITQTPTDGPRIELGRPWAGRLPLSRSLVEVPGNEAVAKLRESKSTPAMITDALAALITGKDVSPVIPLMSSMPNGRMLAARVEKLTVDGATLKATLRQISTEPASH